MPVILLHQSWPEPIVALPPLIPFSLQLVQLRGKQPVPGTWQAPPVSLSPDPQTAVTADGVSWPPALGKQVGRSGCHGDAAPKGERPGKIKYHQDLAM